MPELMCQALAEMLGRVGKTVACGDQKPWLPIPTLQFGCVLLCAGHFSLSFGFIT